MQWDSLYVLPTVIGACTGAMYSYCDQSYAPPMSDAFLETRRYAALPITLHHQYYCRLQTPGPEILRFP